MQPGPDDDERDRPVRDRPGDDVRQPDVRDRSTAGTVPFGEGVSGQMRSLAIHTTPSTAMRPAAIPTERSRRPVSPVATSQPIARSSIQNTTEWTAFTALTASASRPVDLVVSI